VHGGFALNRYRISLCGLVATAASLIAASPAPAGTLTVDYPGGAATYKAAAGESNDVAVRPIGGKMTVIQDHGVADVPLSEVGGSACMLMEPWKYKCPTAGIATLDVDLADGADAFYGGVSALAESVSAGPGGKTISTGGGDDQIFTRNGAADQISCGAGADTVVADSQDVVASDCEQVDIGDGIGAGAPDAYGTAANGTGSTTGAAQGGPAPRGAQKAFETALGLTLPGRALLMPRPDMALVPLACAATASAGCRGDIVLELPAGAAKRATKLIAARGHYLAQQRARRLGARRYRLAAGEKTAMPLRIRFRGHFTAVEKRRRKRAVLKIAERDATGKVVDVQTRVVTLRSSKNSPRRHQ
ncbi:MAG: hypothetical protein ACJ768_12265, partial [Gaiellaceae bacterium]